MEIEVGYGCGCIMVNLNLLVGYDGLLLVGFVLLDYVCMVYCFEVSGEFGCYCVVFGIMLMFNKWGGL